MTENSEKDDFSTAEELEAKRAFTTGENFHARKLLGLHKLGNGQYRFRVWAPNAEKVWVVGDFNDWQVTDVMTCDGSCGIWEATLSTPKPGDLYKFRIQQKGGNVIDKFDPFSVKFEKRPNNAAEIYTLQEKKWKDGLWHARKKRSNYFRRPLNIYEVHSSSWRHHDDGTPYSFSDLKETLIPYVKEMGYTHIEFMPLMEHPLGASWGYQLTGYFALSASYGTPEEFQDFVEACHLQNIGVLLDWVPGHFSVNNDALAYYDGTPQFEYTDPDRAKNIRWGSLNFDLGKPQVQSFLISSLLFWLETFHVDGIRVDAVSNMIYRDYDEGPWLPNHEGGNRNLEGYYFLQKLNAVVKKDYPEALMIAEESSSETQVTGLIETGALGFDFKWNMGWMNDVLRFYEMDPIHRKHHFELVTFSFMYMLNEHYILPLSHDEVVHGKKSLMHKMWGDRYKQFAQLRNLYTFMMTHPGKKLLFMGSEWGQFLEWKYDEGLEWVDLDDALNHAMQQFTRQLNQFYKDERALWELDDVWETLEVIDADNREESVLSFIRHGKRKTDFLIVILNMTPVERRGFTIGVPYKGTYREVFNTEMAEFGGTWQSHNPDCVSQPQAFKQYTETISTTVPALGAIILKPEKIKVTRKRTSGKGAGES